MPSENTPAPSPPSQFLIRRIRRPLAGAAACLLATLPLMAAPGLDAPEAIGPYLDGRFPPADPSSGAEWSVRQSYGNILINLPMHLAPFPGTGKLLCVAKEGRIVLFDDDDAASGTSVLLDHRGETFTSSDSGMTWLAFHPDFGTAGNPNRGYVYVTYKWRPDLTQPAGVPGAWAYWRLSRFTVPDNPATNVPDGSVAIDPASEQVMIQQLDRQQWHDSGCMTFGPDGYLYVAVGDEGGANDEFQVSQKLDDRLFSGILRIDVDQGPGSHAIPRQPAQVAVPAGWPANFTAHYTIPNDNPFDPVADGGAAGDYLEEFYAIGLRQPYRFSYDAVSDRFWIGESGQDTAEEVCILAPGANYGWAFREGSVAGPRAQPARIHGTLTAPVWDVLHANGPDGCVVGGFVYRGAAHPSLTGRYLTVDNVSGRIRAFTYQNGAASAEILTGMPSGAVYQGTSTIGRDHAGEPVFVKINGTGSLGQFYKLVTAPPAPNQPVWYRFEDREVSNTGGYVADNPEGATTDHIAGGVRMVVSGVNANASYGTSNGLLPSGETANGAGLRCALGDGNGPPGNANGHMETEWSFGSFDDFTIELSFRPEAGSLAGGYQCFLGLDGATGTSPDDGETGPPLQPFRLMRWGRDDANATSIPLENGDLYLNIRSFNEAAQQWTTVPLEIFDNSEFTGGRWYHLAIVGDAAAGTVTVYSHEEGAYIQRAQAAGYVGNLQAGVWSVGRGMYNSARADWVTDTTFDEVRIANRVIPPTEFLYSGQAWDPQIVATEPPPLLSQTGAFSDLATLTPAQGVFPYDVIAPLWSDGAAKQRWIALPNDGTHDTPQEKIGFRPDGPWSFPAGTALIKHFELPVDDGDPSAVRRLETRFILIPESGEPWGVTYRWREDGSDAELLADGLLEDIEISGAGGNRVQTWYYPSRTDCRLCHNANAGHVLGLKTWQMNGPMFYPRTGRSANQLETLGSLGWFDGNYRPEHLPWFLQAKHISDTGADPGERVRSYIDSNCAQCHLPGGVRAEFDARFSTPLAEQNLIRGAIGDLLSGPDDRVVAPGNPEASVLRVRHAALGPIQMPPLAKSIVDEEAAQVITEWIESLPDAPGVVLDAPSTAGGAFVVNVTFSEPVTGLAASDFLVTGGTAGPPSGGGMDYQLTITPSAYGEVAVSLPAGRVANGEGLANYASATTRVLVSDPGLVTWLEFDETTGATALDSSPMENHGTLVDMEPEDRVAGVHGGALAFDNSGEKVTLSNVATEDFTITFWFRTEEDFPVTEFPPGGHALAHADAPGPQPDFMITGTRSAALVNRVSFQTGQGGGVANTVLHGTVPIVTGEWTHVAVTRERVSGAMALHINGAPSGTATGGSAALTANPVLNIGGNGEGTGLRGEIDQFRIHNHVLPPSEIAALFSESSGPPPYQQWLDQWLPGLGHLHGMDVDIEPDGNTNFKEFAFGGDPLGWEVIDTPFTANADGTFTISFAARRETGAADYHVEVGGTLEQWSDADPHITGTTREGIEGTDYESVTITYQPPEPVDALFFRVRAVPE